MNARGIAFDMLKDIYLNKTYSNLLLRKGLDQAKPQDKGLITQIVYGTLQNYRLCRYQWEDCVKKLPSDEVCVLLDLSVYQLFYMDKLPAYAIINDAVEITKKQIHVKMAKLVMPYCMRYSVGESGKSQAKRKRFWLLKHHIRPGLYRCGRHNTAGILPKEFVKRIWKQSRMLHV